MQKIVKISLWVGGAVLLLVVIIVLATVFSISKNSTTAGISVGMPQPGISYGRAVVAPSVTEEMAVNYQEDAVTAVDNSQPAQTDRLIIKTGSLSLVVKDVKAGVSQITAYAEKNKGFVVSSDISKEGVALYGEITIRIPAKIFDQGVADVKAMGEVQSEKINGQDVTEEYVDLDSQLKNLRAAESQFLQIMQRAVEIEDVLAVQGELTNVRGQIESIQGRMKYLKQSADLSTLTVYLSTDPNVLPAVDSQDKWKPWAEVKSAARSLLVMAKGLANFIIWLVVYIPLWLVIGLVVWGVVRLIKRKKQV